LNFPSRSVKVMVAVSPASSELLLDVSAMVGGVVSMFFGAECCDAEELGPSRPVFPAACRC